MYICIHVYIYLHHYYVCIYMFLDLYLRRNNPIEPIHSQQGCVRAALVRRAPHTDVCEPLCSSRQPVRHDWVDIRVN